MAHDESRDVDRRRAATGLARALARPAQLLGVGECTAQLLGGDGAGAAGLAPITALGMGARDDHARQRSRARPRVLQTGSADGYLCTRPVDGDRQRHTSAHESVRHRE